MTDNELILIEAIRQSADPEKALITAIEIITDFLKLQQSFVVQEPVYQQELS